MLPREFIERVKKPEDVEDWMLPVINEVYTFHDSISDVNGKDEISAIFNEKGYQGVYDMYRELHPMEYNHQYGTKKDKHAVIIGHRVDIYDNYDVSYEHYCLNTQKNSIKYVYDYVCKELNEKYPELLKNMDYFNIDIYYRYRDINIPFPDFHCISVFYVTGGSEGHYIHVEAISPDGSREIVFIGKTFLGREHAEQAVNAISRVMEV